MILLDTNAFIWWLSDRSKLPSKALNKIELSSKQGEIFVSAISIWEVCILVAKKRINLNNHIDLWINELDRLTDIEFIPIDNHVAYLSTHLPGTFHKDPADRFIVATAISHNLTVVTKDQKILEYKHVKALW